MLRIELPLPLESEQRGTDTVALIIATGATDRLFLSNSQMLALWSELAAHVPQDAPTNEKPPQVIE